MDYFAVGSCNDVASFVVPIRSFCLYTTSVRTDILFNKMSELWTERCFGVDIYLDMMLYGEKLRDRELLHTNHHCSE